MYERIKAALLALLRVPPEPHDPMGDVRSLRVFRAAPGYLRYITVGWALVQFGILAAGLLTFVPLLIAGAASGIVAIVVAVLAVLAAAVFVLQAAVSFFSLRLNYEMRWYKVTDRSLRIRAGVWNVNEMTMTFANVQNITVTQGPLERLFGIANVRVDTAGGGSGDSGHGKGPGPGANLHVAIFAGVDNPDEIRDLMLQRLRQVRGAGLGDLEDLGRPRSAAVGPGLPQLDDLSVLTALRDESRALRRAAESL